MNRNAMCTAEFLAVIFLLLFPALFLITVVIDRPPGPSCANNLKQLGLALEMYSSEQPRGEYPPLGFYRQPAVDCDDPAFPETGDVSEVYTGFVYLPSIYPDYMPDVAMAACMKEDGYKRWSKTVNERITSEYDKVCLQLDRGVESILASYTYFGYAFGPRPGEFELPADTVKATSLEGLHSIVQSEVDDFELLISPGLFYDYLVRMKNEDPDALFESLRNNIDFNDQSEFHSLPSEVRESFASINSNAEVFLLRKGIERFFVYTARGHAIPRVKSTIPILADRITTNTNDLRHGKGRSVRGGNVLYLDGHVEFVEYAPENFPISPGMALLHESIDASPVFQKRF